MGVALLMLIGASCGTESGRSSPPSDPVSEGRLVLYTSMPISIVDRLEAVFEGAFPRLHGNLWFAAGSDTSGGIELIVVRGRTADLEDRIAADLDEMGFTADVIWLADPSPYEAMKVEGLLAPYSPPADVPIPDEYVDPDGYYVAGRIINVVPAWNTDLCPEGIDGWEELPAANSVFPSPASGAARAAIKALSDTSPDFFPMFAAAGGASVSSNGIAREGLAAGKYRAGASLDYMVRRAAAGGAPIDWTFPATGTVVVPSPLAITANAQNPEAARTFMDFILSKTGQQIIVEIGSFYPARTDVAPPGGAPSLTDVKAIDVDWTELAAEKSAIESMWHELFGEQ